MGLEPTLTTTFALVSGREDIDAELASLR